MAMEINGLSTKEALRRLHQCLEVELDTFKSKDEGYVWLKTAMHHNSAHSMFRWPSALLVLLEVIVFIIVFAVDSSGAVLLGDALFLLCVWAFNIALVSWNARLRHQEMHHRAKDIIASVSNCIHQHESGFHWGHTGPSTGLHQPQSPCISLQWTRRDSRRVNLPVPLLVNGDVITVRPGHQVPGRCSLITRDAETELVLEEGDTYIPETTHSSTTFAKARLRRPVEPRDFLMLEAPFLKYMRLCLHNALERPVTVFDKEHRLVHSHYLEKRAIPPLLILVLVLKLVEWRYLGCSATGIILQPALAVLPLLPLALPLMWLTLSALGTARLLLQVRFSKALPCNKEDPFEEMDEFLSSGMPEQRLAWGQLRKLAAALLWGQEAHLWRSSSLLQVLGSVTTLCCVDKKGILSWPNPTPEKVFFLKPPSSTSIHHDDEDNPVQDLTFDHAVQESGDAFLSCKHVDVFGEEGTDSAIEMCTAEDEGRQAPRSSGDDPPDHMYHPGSRVEVLDLTQSMQSAFGVQFDDPRWKDYIANLKPLGLSILLNTCNPATQEKYTHFCDHIACESLHNESAVPVVNKRCLCDLAVQIGFTEKAVEGYQFLQHIALFRHVQPEVIQKGRLARSLNFPRLKMPFPNACCAIVKELSSGTMQMFTQGTADLVLDLCSEYWDGRDLCLLSDSDRKRILDFYQRSSLTAYCMAFSYAPLLTTSGKSSVTPLHPDLETAYLQLPPDSSHLFSSVSKKLGCCPVTHQLELEAQTGGHYLSTDSICMEDDGTPTDLSATVSCLSNQVFIGMVTMQYQACPDFVKLIEQLDNACIRFVHFSKENELRSRGFSEKMGLESGWNCHVSLLSDKQRTECTTSTGHLSQASGRSATSDPSSSLDLVDETERLSVTDRKPYPCPPRSISAPNIVNIDTSTSGRRSSELFCSRNNSLVPGARSNVQETDETNRLWCTIDGAPSPSSDTDSSAPVAFDISNRAKLPRGIENIRPHMEQVDNVPLLVSLFTDCTPEATLEMVRIMQEYGEVVCCFGSALHLLNLPVFLQADCSIAVEPLAPQLCGRQSQCSPQTVQEHCLVTPWELARTLGSLPCVLSGCRDDRISLYHLIMEARHYTMVARSAMQFLLCCGVSLSLAQFLGCLLMLPPLLSATQLLWLGCVALPILSASLLVGGCLQVDPQVMSCATGKNLKRANKQNCGAPISLRVTNDKFADITVAAKQSGLIQRCHRPCLEKPAQTSGC
ncbi:transmembrane protein 94-like isoform X2 [Ornithodoros turicata]|uniref:transmembrane protein 94-like isoform X2 n=1 Tax=Ornithodoros turicata TaxID=34597 RepID=UPI003138F4A0